MVDTNNFETNITNTENVRTNQNTDSQNHISLPSPDSWLRFLIFLSTLPLAYLGFVYIINCWDFLQISKSFGTEIFYSPQLIIIPLFLIQYWVVGLIPISFCWWLKKGHLKGEVFTFESPCGILNAFVVLFVVALFFSIIMFFPFLIVSSYVGALILSFGISLEIISFLSLFIGISAELSRH